MPQRPSPTRAALVTGASAGFGLLTSVALARAGFRVFATMRNVERVGPLEEACATAGVEVEILPLDVTDAGSIAAAVATVTERAGGVDVLINNAGIGIGGFFEDVSDAELREQFDTNFFGAAALIRAVLPGMRARGWGRVINLSSVNGRFGAPGVSAYTASKHALEGLSESLRFELLPFGVHVVLIEPGVFRTEIFGRNRRVSERTHTADSPYAQASARMEAQVDQLVEGSRADPAAVAAAVVKAAQARRPALRYPVGRDVHLVLNAKATLPARIFEVLVMRVVRPWFP